MHKKSFMGFAGLLVLSLCATACKDTRTLQENQQLKAQVAELQKENGDLGNQIETLTAARDQLTREKSALQARLEKNSQKKRARSKTAKTASRKHPRSRNSQPS